MSGGWFWQALGWVALALNVWGNLALTAKGSARLVIRLASNACWIPYGIVTSAWALLANHLLFSLINAYGWWKWKRKRKRKRKSSQRRGARLTEGGEWGHPGRQLRLDGIPKHRWFAPWGKRGQEAIEAQRVGDLPRRPPASATPREDVT